MPAVSACPCSLQLDDGMQCAQQRRGARLPPPPPAAAAPACCRRCPPLLTSARSHPHPSALPRICEPTASTVQQPEPWS